MDLTIPLVSNLLKYPYYFWKFESKIKKNNCNCYKHKLSTGWEVLSGKNWCQRSRIVKTALLFSFFYVIREFDRFLDQG